VQSGAVEIGKVRTEAGQKMTAAAFAKSHGLSAGDRLEANAEEKRRWQPARSDKPACWAPAWQPATIAR
jgi:hypothetical protein